MSEYSGKYNESQATRGNAKLTEFDTFYQQHLEDENVNQKRLGSTNENSEEFHRLNALRFAEDDIEEV